MHVGPRAARVHQRLDLTNEILIHVAVGNARAQEAGFAGSVPQPVKLGGVAPLQFAP